jgi:hypothetical protein
MTEHIPPTYDDYADLVTKFATLYHESKHWGLNSSETTQVEITIEEIRLIYLSLMTTKASLKKYDPKKGLNQ